MPTIPILRIFKVDFPIKILNVKITANNDFKMVPDNLNNRGYSYLCTGYCRWNTTMDKQFTSASTRIVSSSSLSHMVDPDWIHILGKQRLPVYVYVTCQCSENRYFWRVIAHYLLVDDSYEISRSIFSLKFKSVQCNLL